MYRSSAKRLSALVVSVGVGVFLAMSATVLGADKADPKASKKVKPTVVPVSKE